MNKEYF